MQFCIFIFFKLDKRFILYLYIIFQTLQYLKEGQSRMCDEGIFVYCYVIWYSDRRQLLSSIQQDALNLSQRQLIGHIYSPPVSTSAKSYQISHYY